MRTGIAVAAVLSLVSIPLAAQSVGKLEGMVREKVATRSIGAARVSLVSVESTGRTFTANPDPSGRYALDSLPAGRYLVQVSSPTLDSLELALPPDEVRIDAGATAHADFSLPSGARLRDAVCHGLTVGPEQIVVAGRAIDADTEQPIAGAQVIAAWTELSLDRATLKAKTQKRGTVVSTGPRGEYRLCGVPAERWLTMQLQHEGRGGAIVRLTVSPDEGAAVRDLSLSLQSAPTLTVLDSIERLGIAAGADSTRQELQLVGTAALTGYVRTPSGAPLSDVQVRVRDARSSSVTDANGRYHLATLPAGTQVIMVRQLGYAISEIPVELRPERITSVDVTLTRATTLDSVLVVAPPSHYAEFERNRRSNSFGRFLTVEEIKRRNVKQTSDLLIQLGGFIVSGNGRTAKIFSKQANALKPTCGTASVMISGTEGFGINDLDPSQIYGIEIYRDGAGAPARYTDRAECGLVMIWTKAEALGSRRSGAGVGDKRDYNGYQ
jgi:hypothetical protein